MRNLLEMEDAECEMWREEESCADSSCSRSECGRLRSKEVVCFIKFLDNNDVEVRCVEVGSRLDS